MKIARQAIDFQSDFDRLVAEPAPMALRLWPVLGMTLIAALVALASVIRLDVVVSARGRIAADAPPVILAPMASAILRSLAVHPGDRVEKGQVLARLDPTTAEADRAALSARRDSLLAEAARLEANLSGHPMPAGDRDLGLQAQVQLQRSSLAAAQRASLTAARDAAAGALEAERNAEAGLTRRLAIADQVATIRATLAASQTGSRLAAMEADLARIDAQAALDQHSARLKDLAARLSAAEAALSAFDSDRRRADLEALAALRPQMTEVEEALRKAERIAAMTDLVAPGPGVVISVAPGGAGSTLSEGTPVVVLVPSDVPLVAEVTIRSADAGMIRPGDPVDIKVDAFPWRRHGMLTGQLIEVSSASYTPEGASGAEHPARIRLTGTLHGLPDDIGLLPGMSLEADVKTGTRSLLDYFLDPLLRGLSEALREP